MNRGLTQLQPYPFEKLNKLLSGITPKESEIALTIGEPQHQPPDRVIQTLRESLHLVNKYPATRGIPELRQTISTWLSARFGISIDSEQQILPVNGTREALFAFAQCIVEPNRTKKDDAHALVAMPDPGYQIYEGAAYLAGATPLYLPNRSDWIPDFAAIDAATWDNVQLLYVCSPGNPTGKVFSLQDWQLIFTLADKHNFVIAADECYSELYPDEDTPPLGILEACRQSDRNDFSRCVVFHSLSKRSNLPGLRSGFVAGDAQLINAFFRYRTYHGCAMSLINQQASITAWSDETHVASNRDAYRAKFATVLNTLHTAGLNDFAQQPDASFYLWATVPQKRFGGDDEAFAKALYAATGVKCLPGRYLGQNGIGRLRLSLVPTLEDCQLAAQRLVHFLTLN